MGGGGAALYEDTVEITKKKKDAVIEHMQELLKNISKLEMCNKFKPLYLPFICFQE